MSVQSDELNGRQVDLPERIPGRILLECISIAVLTKLAVFVFCAYMFPFDKHPAENIFSIWNRWDAKHYLQIAESWYSPTTLSTEAQKFNSHFPPLFPLFIRAIQFVTQLSFLHAGMLCSIITGLATASLLAQLCWLEFKSRRIVLRAGLMFHLYPTSYFLIAPYSEGLFFVCALSFFIFMRHRKSLFLGSLAFALSLAARFTSITLSAPLLWEIWKDGSANWKKRLLAGALGPIIVLSLVLILNEITWGDPLFFLRYSFHDPKNQRYPIVPLSETCRVLIQLCNHIFHGTLNSRFIYSLGAGAILTLLALTITAIGFFGKMLPLSYSIFSFTYILFYASFNWGIANARYSYCAFPIFFVLAQIRLHVLFWTIAAVFGATLLTFSLRYVFGYWAF